MYEADLVVLADAGQAIQDIRSIKRLRFIDQVRRVELLCILVQVVNFGHADQFEVPCLERPVQGVPRADLEQAV